MSSFIPHSPPNTPICEGIDTFNAARPPVSSELFLTQSLFLALSFTLLAISLPIVYVLRRHSRFRKVRPFRLTLGWSACCFAWIFVAHFPQLTSNFPCAVMVIGFCFSLNGFAAILTLRSLVLTVETLYSKRIQQEKRIVGDNNTNNTDHMSVSTSTGTGGNILSISVTTNTVTTTLHQIKILAKIGLGLTHPDSVTLENIVTAKGSMTLAAFTLTFPATLTCIVLLSAFPELAVCNCQDAIFYEVIIAFLFALSVDVIVCARCIYVAWKTASKSDPQGVLPELASTIMMPAVCALIIWCLVGIDPGSLYLTRRITWFYGTAFSFSSYWVIVVGYQLFVVYVHHRRIMAATTTTSSSSRNNRILTENNSTTAANSSITASNQYTIPPLMETLSTDEELRQEFLQFATVSLVSESIRFLEDIASYKAFFYEKGDTFRKSKAKALCEAYIIPGAKFEINISYSMRSRARKAIEAALSTPTSDSKILFDTFDECQHEVIEMIEKGTWREFILKKKRRDSKSNGGGGGAVVVVVGVMGG
jgi:hypothetical protein